MSAKEMIERYKQHYNKPCVVEVLVFQRGQIAKIKNFCYNLFRK